MIIDHRLADVQEHIAALGLVAVPSEPSTNALTTNQE